MTVMPKKIPTREVPAKEIPSPDMGNNVVVGRAVEVSSNNGQRNRSRKKKRRSNS